MNKLALLLPKPLLKKYATDHASELTVEDFFKLSSKIRLGPSVISVNDTLSKDPSVLSYFMDRYPKEIYLFKEEAFSQECIQKITDDIYSFSAYDFLKIPILLKNPAICEYVVASNPNNLHELDSSLITENIVLILERLGYAPTEDDYAKYPILFKSTKLIEKTIKNNPFFILKVNDLTEELIKYAIKSGYVPKKEHFNINPSLANSKIVIEEAFKYDPSMIVYFTKEQITMCAVESARGRGYVATEEDLINNSNLCNDMYIMEDAVRANPKLIIYAGENCSMWNVVDEALEHYKITKEDIEKHPSIVKNQSIIEKLPEFSIYSPLKNYDEKVDLVTSKLRESFDLTIDDLPFLDSKYGGILDFQDLSQLLPYLNISINENEQNKHIKNLEQIADAIVMVRYKKDKVNFKYPDAVSINQALVKAFSGDVPSSIDRIITDLNVYVNGTIHIDEIKSIVEAFYEEYRDAPEMKDLRISYVVCVLIHVLLKFI